MMRQVSSQTPWKDISQSINPFSACCNFMVVNGKGVKFLEESWVKIAFSHSIPSL